MKAIDLTQILDMTTPELIELALVAEGDEFWLLSGAICGRVDESAIELATKLWEAGHADPWDEPEARRLIVKLRDAIRETEPS